MPLADGPPYLLLRRGTSFNSYSPLSQSSREARFELITGAHVLKLEWDGQKKKVVAAIYYEGRPSRPSSIRQRICHRVRPSRFAQAAIQFGLQRSSKRDRQWRRYARQISARSSPRVVARRHGHPDHVAIPPCIFDATAPRRVGSPPCLLMDVGAFGTIGKIKSRFGKKTSYFGVQVFGTMVPKEEYYVVPEKGEKDEFGFPALEVHIGFDEKALDNVVVPENTCWGC